MITPYDKLKSLPNAKNYLKLAGTHLKKWMLKQIR